jgi:acyl carrier protein
MNDTLISLFAECLNVAPESLSEDSSPDNISEWDSLAAMSLVAAIEERYAVRLSTRDIMSMRTIGIARSVLKGKGVPGI